MITIQFLHMQQSSVYQGNLQGKKEETGIFFPGFLMYKDEVPYLCKSSNTSGRLFYKFRCPNLQSKGTSLQYTNSEHLI